jgi:hypothetical protein
MELRGTAVRRARRAGEISFYHERFGVLIDGVPRERVSTPLVVNNCQAELRAVCVGVRQVALSI